jgi:hypothetical protein
MQGSKLHLVSDKNQKRTRRSSRSSVLQIVSEEYALDLPPVSAAQLSALWLMLNTSSKNSSEKEGALRESA